MSLTRNIISKSTITDRTKNKPFAILQQNQLSEKLY